MERVSQERRSTKQAEQIESLEKDAAQVRERIEDAAEEWARYVEVNLPLFVRAKLNRNAKAHSGFGRIGQFIGKAGVTKHTNGRSSAVHRNSRLWKEMARIICEVRPRYAFIENSPMLVTNALVWRRGIVLDGIEEWKDQDPVSASQHAHSVCLEQRIELMRFDNIGVGAGAKGEFRQLQQSELDSCNRGFQRVQVEQFNAAAVSNPEQEYQPGRKNKDHFYNLKAQGWGLLADRFMNTWRAVEGKSYDPDKLISLPSNMPLVEQLCAELAQARRVYMNGKLMVEKKAGYEEKGS
jgi:hypothetical protein